jgi:hypothetical protein
LAQPPSPLKLTKHVHAIQHEGDVHGASQRHHARPGRRQSDPQHEVKDGQVDAETDQADGAVLDGKLGLTPKGLPHGCLSDFARPIQRMMGFAVADAVAGNSSFAHALSAHGQTHARCDFVGVNPPGGGGGESGRRRR